MNDSGQEEDVIETVDHDVTEKKAHHSSLVLLDVAIQAPSSARQVAT
jgi:hypothetical protein